MRKVLFMNKINFNYHSSYFQKILLVSTQVNLIINMEWNHEIWQGRSKQQIETNYRFLGITISSALLCFVGIIIYRLISTI